MGLHITAGNGGLNAAMRFASRYVHVILKLPPRNTLVMLPPRIRVYRVEPIRRHLTDNMIIRACPFVLSCPPRVQNNPSATWYNRVQGVRVG